MSYQRAFEDRVRVGIVGVGDHAYRNLLPLLTFLPVDLVAIADTDAELGARTAQQYGRVPHYETATTMYENEELDAVLICVSPRLHPQLTLEALDAGLHVWMEKPASITVRGVDDMIRARAGRVVVVGYKKAFMPATAKVVELAESSALGDVRSISATYPLVIPHGDRALIERGEPSMWLANGCHPTAFALAVAGAAQSVVVHRGREGANVVVIRHTSGALTSIHSALGISPAHPFERYTVYGMHGAVEVENGRRVVFWRATAFNYSTTSNFAPPGLDSAALVWEPQDSLGTLETKAEFTQGMHGELAYFLDCVRTGTEPTMGNLEFARQLAGIYEAGILSDGDEVALEDLN
ncbi:Gfo/Idh/MocA family protein [Nonomuraea insulae]|uniref:Gfo/Idh/MocA family protein n=1 Tax=Nonomuraea insulae TaxID=1616787 RepID=A0ABW1D634_9ACTN